MEGIREEVKPTCKKKYNENKCIKGDTRFDIFGQWPFLLRSSGLVFGFPFVLCFSTDARLCMCVWKRKKKRWVEWARPTGFTVCCTRNVAFLSSVSPLRRQNQLFSLGGGKARRFTQFGFMRTRCYELKLLLSSDGLLYELIRYFVADNCS